MKFYSEDQIARYEAPEGSWGYFYEAKDLTKHPFLDRYREELIARIRRDRTNIHLGMNVRKDMDDSDNWPKKFAEFVDDQFEYHLRVGFRRGDSSRQT